MSKSDLSSTAAPVIVRLAGLPAEVMEAFASQACLDEARSLLRGQDELVSARAQMVHHLHQKIHDALPADRRILLAVKRDCYNGRSLSARRSTPAWPLIHDAAAPLTNQICELEDKLTVEWAQLHRTLQEEHERERHHLLQLLGEENLRRGLTLASPSLLGNARRLQKPASSYGRKEKGLEQSLLRYVSRAALKLSPFSTLTRVGLGMVASGSDPRPVTLVGDRWKQRHLLRIKRHTLNHYYTLLLLHPAFRSRQRIVLNGTIERIEPTRYRFVRPAHWLFNREAETLEYREDALLRVNLEGSLIGTLREVLAESRPLGQLIDLLSSSLGREPGELMGPVEALLDIGFLQFLCPWPTNDIDADRTFLAVLRSLAPDAAILEVAGALERSLTLSGDGVPTDSLSSIMKEIDAMSSQGLHALCSVVGASSLKTAIKRNRRLNEDVFLLPQNGGGQGEIARVSRDSAERAIASAKPLVRFSNFLSRHYEFLHTVQALATERWPGRREVAFLDLFEASQSLWRDYMKFMRTAHKERERGPWNPLGLDAIADLQRQRQDITTQLGRCLRPEGEDHVFHPEEVEEVVGRIPDCYAPVVGPCLFMQPVEPGGDLWVVNRLLDGTGHYSSRHTAVMDSEMRDRYTTHLRRRAVVDLNGEPFELVDILYARGDHLNVHAVQTPRVLEMPGENSDLPPARRLGLLDLRVRLDGPLPVLVDSCGRGILPVYLGTMSLLLMPMLLKFLSQFGLGEFVLRHLPLPVRRQGDTEFYGRLRIGNLLVKRRHWVFSPAALFDAHVGASDAELFLAANRWRSTQGIPERVFIAEKLPVEFFGWEVHKPQYINFSSPSFVSVFRTCLGSCKTRLSVVEMLPTPEAFPVDQSGRRWAFEVQLESITMERAVLDLSPEAYDLESPTVDSARPGVGHNRAQRAQMQGETHGRRNQGPVRSRKDRERRDRAAV